ncbi:S-adenosyl-L-methionine-dependent methyltransferase [Paraphysoderma sedebokerense]|nr:S-adenosyl-L-methionine-dependent methyltransferase [Paraphysoderma sedebokerense]
MQITSDDWTEYAAPYHSRFEHTTRKFAIDCFLLSKIYLFSLPSPSTPISALDLACGSGSFERALFQLHRDRPSVLESMNMDLIATDYSSGMVALVSDYINSNATVGPKNIRITTQVQDGQTLPLLGQNSIDIVYSNFGLFLFNNRKSAFESISRVLKPNGILIFSSWTAAPNADPTTNTSNSLFDVIGHLMMLLPERLRPAPPSGQQTTPPPTMMDFSEATKIKNQIEMYGSNSLKYIKSYRSTTTMFFESLYEVWMFMIETSPLLAKVFRMLSVDETVVMMQKLREIFATKSDSEPVLMDAVALITVVKKI